MPHLNEQQKLYLKQLLLVLCLLTLSITLSIGLIIGTYLIKPDRLLSLPYIPHKENCTAYLTEFPTHRTLSSKISQISKTLDCLEKFQYPLNQEYIDLKNNFRQLNANPTIDQFLEISHQIVQIKIAQDYLKSVTAPPIARYLWLLIPYSAILIIFSLIGLGMWLILVSYVDYYFLDSEISNTLLALFTITILTE